MGMHKQIRKIRNLAIFSARALAYGGNRSNRSLPYDWKSSNFNRIAIVNAAIQARGGAAVAEYLEIGCAENDCFDSVTCLDKTGVDPKGGGTIRTTSDEFFAANARSFDVIHIDGLHRFEQCRRDAANAIHCCKQGGFVIFHDFMPVNWREAHIPRLQVEWTGDVWKTAFELAKTDGIEFRLVEIDHGVGVAKKVSADPRYHENYEELAALTFDHFVDMHESLPLVGVEDALRFIGGGP